MILGISYDSVEDQKAFASEQSFPYGLLSDPDRAVSRSYQAEREPGEEYFDYGIPRRISYLIDPDGRIHGAYNVEAAGGDFTAHSAEVLADIRAAG